MRRDYAYLSTLGLRKKPLFPVTRCATTKPGRYEMMTMNGQMMNAAQTKVNAQIQQNRLMTIVYPSGNTNEYSVPGVSTFESGKNIKDPKNLYRDLPGVFSDFGKAYTRGVGPNPDQVAEGFSRFFRPALVLSIQHDLPAPKHSCNFSKHFFSVFNLS